MIPRLAFYALFGVGILPAAAPPQTQRLEFPAGGLLRIENSSGEIQIEGWDQPQIEVTTLNSHPEVKVSAERHNDEVVLKTSFPHSRWHPLPLGSHKPDDVTYVIKAPRNARLAIIHGEGEVHITEVTGDIRATVSRGTITLSLAPVGPYDIDARSQLGSVVSDFAGHLGSRLWFFGHAFTEHPSETAQKLYLRTGFGDIIILKTR